MSDAEWDKDDYEPPAVAKPVFTDKWEGEDEDDVKDNWDDDDSKENAKQPDGNTISTVQPKKKKSLIQIIAEKEEKQRKELEEKLEKIQEDQRLLSPEEAFAEKQRRQKMQEESDFELAKDTFGIEEVTGETISDGVNLNTKEDFDEYRKEVVEKFLQFEKSPHFVLFLDELFRELSVNLEVDDIKKLSSTLTAVATEKSKAQKGLKAKPKKKKAGLNIGKGNSNDLDLDTFGNEFDDFI